jgi:fructose-1,6-bisphosphatase II
MLGNPAQQDNGGVMMNRELSMEFVRVTEAAAIASARGVGRGDKNGIDQLAVDAMRKMFDTVNISGTVVIGEGEMDEAPMLYIGEHVGAGGPEVDIAVDPVEGTNLVAKGQPGAIAVIAIAPKGCLLHAPDMYMDKIAVGPRAKGCINIDDPVSANLERVAKALNRKVGDLTVVALDRPRHRKIIEEVRAAGARIRLISDGDVDPIINAGIEGTGIHMYIGRGGAPEGVLAAAGLKCLGGDMQARLCPENEEQEERCHKMGIPDVKQILTIDDLVKGDDVMFTASGITNCDLLHGVNFFGNGARTHTISMRYATGTVRFVDAVHTFDRSNINIKL